MSFVRNIVCMLSLTMLFASCGTGDSTSGTESAVTGGGEGEQECAFTQGYWKNHPEAWPVDSLQLGGVQYSKAELLAILATPVAGNGLISLAHQLIAAKLNVANGAGGGAISSQIDAADALIGNREVPPGGSGYLAPSSTSSLVGALDGFNNTGECRRPECGDGHVDAGEQCDDANTSNTDGCLNTCVSASCGDGYTHAGVEACDDGNAIDNDTCSNTCEICPPPPVCGDGHVDAGEQCDDANTSNTDGCLNSCVSASCGDGYTHADVEECDDGNSVDNDTCSNTCRICIP